MREHLATLLNDFRRNDRQIAVAQIRGNRRHATTYGELARLAGRFATLLVQRNVGPGDRVLLWAENSAEWIAAFYGCMLRGALAVPLDAAGSADFAARVASDIKPSLVVGDTALIEKLPAEWPRLALDDLPAILPVEEIGPIPDLNRETPLQILFTSGTTGDPKGVVITHGNVLASIGPIEEGAQPYLRYEKYVHPLRILHTLPLSHVFGQTMGLWIPPILTAEVHLESRLVASSLVDTIRRERISVLAAVPRVLALLKTHLETTIPDLTERLADSQVRPAGKLGWKRWWRFRDVHRILGLKFWAFVSGGGALPGPLEQFWNGLGFVLVQGYGMTETTALITLNHPFHVARGTIGKPLAGREVKLGPDGEVLVRGAMISTATWQGGALRQRESEWLATGDLAEQQETGDLRFLGRKSEVIVTAAGINVHPEDLEAALEQEPGVAACAVVPMQTATGPEPCAVLAFRGAEVLAAQAVERANARLAEFQRVRRWVLWPEPDLPRTSTGKVRRKAVTEWLTGIQAAAAGQAGGAAFAAQDWLLVLIAQITGETPAGVGDELRLSEDLHLDSLGRVQLAAAIEERLGMPTGSGMLDEVETLGALRRMVAGKDGESEASCSSTSSAETNGKDVPREARGLEPKVSHAEPQSRIRHTYPTWPWSWPVQWLRAAFIEAIMRPLVWLLAGPRVTVPAGLDKQAPLLIIANHVSTYDGPLALYALPAVLRRRVAAAMSGEMLADYRAWRNPEQPAGKRGFFLLGPLAYYLVTALFNVFPLPRLRDFQASFAHAGKAMDRGYSVLVFPEGTRSAEGRLARFRPGIGLLAKQCGAPVLPIALRGVGELKTGKSRWFHSGRIEVRVGQPIRFALGETEAAITERLHAEVEKLLEDKGR